MKLTSLLLTGILLLSMLAPRAEARRFRRGRSALRTAAALGVIGAIAASSNRGYYGNRYYGGGYGYYAPGYRSYGYSPYYRSTYSYPSYTGSLPFGASYYIDQGDYRNYYDAYNRYLGRERLW